MLGTIEINKDILIKSLMFGNRLILLHSRLNFFFYLLSRTLYGRLSGIGFLVVTGRMLTYNRGFQHLLTSSGFIFFISNPTTSAYFYILQL